MSNNGELLDVVLPDGTYEVTRVARLKNGQLMELERFRDLATGKQSFLGVAVIVVQAPQGTAMEQIRFPIKADKLDTAFQKLPEATEEAVHRFKEQTQSHIVVPGAKPSGWHNRGRGDNRIVDFRP